MGKKKNQRKNSVKVPSYKNTEEMLLSSELADICGLEAGHTASVDQSIKLLWLYIKDKNLFVQQRGHNNFFTPDKKLAKIFGHKKNRLWTKMFYETYGITYPRNMDTMLKSDNIRGFVHESLVRSHLTPIYRANGNGRAPTHVDAGHFNFDPSPHARPKLGSQMAKLPHLEPFDKIMDQYSAANYAKQNAHPFTHITFLVVVIAVFYYYIIPYFSS